MYFSEDFITVTHNRSPADAWLVMQSSFCPLHSQVDSYSAAGENGDKVVDFYCSNVSSL